MKERRSRWRKIRRSVGALLALFVVALVVAVLVWNPYPSGEQRYDRGENGLWLGHKWFSGRDVRSGTPVTLRRS